MGGVSADIVRAPRKLTPGLWYHVACVRDGKKKEARLYVNRELVWKAPTTVNLAQGRSAAGHPVVFAVGLRPYKYSQPFHGQISAVRLSASALSPSQFLPFVAPVSPPPPEKPVMVLTQKAVVESGNVALAKNGTTVVGANNGDQAIDGKTALYSGVYGFASGVLPCEWELTLPKLYLLQQIRLRLHDSYASKFYRYAIETSSDGKTFIPLVDRSKGEWRSWQTITFDPRPVRTIRIKGVHNSDSNWLGVVEIEAYCVPPASAVVPKYPSSPASGSK